jgi:hypothetical protein
MKDKLKSAGLESAAEDRTRQFVAKSEAALVAIAEEFSIGVGPVEEAQAEAIRTALARLLECASQLSADTLMIEGSTRQLRPHPLLKVEQQLRGEVTEGLRRLALSAEQRATFERARALTRKSRKPQ